MPLHCVAHVSQRPKVIGQAAVVQLLNQRRLALQRLRQTGVNYLANSGPTVLSNSASSKLNIIDSDFRLRLRTIMIFYSVVDPN